MHVHDLAHQPSQTTELDTDQVAKLMYALSDPTRLRIMCLLLDNEKLCVGDIQQHIGISMSGTSQQLKSLELYGLATRTKLGQQTCYRPDHDNPYTQVLFDCINTLRRKT